MSGPIDLGVFGCVTGDVWVLPIQDFQADGVTPTDLTAYGSTWLSQLRTTPEDPVVAASIAVDATLAAQGQITLTISAAETAVLTPNQQYVFDVQVSGGPNTPMTMYAGAINVRPDVTRP